METLIDFHAWRQELGLVTIGFSLLYPTSVIGQMVHICADIEERQERKGILQKLKKVSETLQKSTNEKAKDDVEDSRWGLDCGLRLMARLMERLKYDNEWEWRKILQLVKESNLMRHWEHGVDRGNVDEKVEDFAQDVANLSQSIQTDASRYVMFAKEADDCELCDSLLSHGCVYANAQLQSAVETYRTTPAKRGGILRSFSFLFLG